MTRTILRQSKNSVQLLCRCGKRQWCKVGSPCYENSCCVNCMPYPVGVGGGEEPFIPQPGPPIRNKYLPVKRNKPCPCGSGIKFKLCCLPKFWKRQAEILSPLAEKLYNRMVKYQEKQRARLQTNS